MPRRKRAQSHVDDITYPCTKHKIPTGKRCYQCHDQTELFNLDQLGPSRPARHCDGRRPSDNDAETSTQPGPNTTTSSG